jgi:hypothetical protein
MPRSTQEIIDHAGELAARFEGYDPSPDDEVDLNEHLPRRPALDRARSERALAEAVLAARRAGLTWKQTGKQLGTSAQAAQHRYGPLREPA